MTTKSIRQAVAAEVRAAAGRAGLNQKDLGKAAGISTSAISRKWHGDTPWMVEELIRVAKATGSDVADLLPRVTESLAA